MLFTYKIRLNVDIRAAHVLVSFRCNVLYIVICISFFLLRPLCYLFVFVLNIFVIVTFLYLLYIEPISVYQRFA